jgi:hypothetical protein
MSQHHLNDKDAQVKHLSAIIKSTAQLQARDHFTYFRDCVILIVEDRRM